MIPYLQFRYLEISENKFFKVSGKVVRYKTCLKLIQSFFKFIPFTVNIDRFHCGNTFQSDDPDSTSSLLLLSNNPKILDTKPHSFRQKIEDLYQFVICHYYHLLLKMGLTFKKSGSFCYQLLYILKWHQ